MVFGWNFWLQRESKKDVGNPKIDYNDINALNLEFDYNQCRNFTTDITDFNYAKQSQLVHYHNLQ